MTNQELLDKLKKHVGLRAYAALRRGAVLHCWCCSSPHNYWVENRKGDYVWHSDGWGDRPNLSMFIEVKQSIRRIASSWVHSDGGKPESSDFKLKPEFLVRKAKKKAK